MSMNIKRCLSTQNKVTISYGKLYLGWNAKACLRIYYCTGTFQTCFAFDQVYIDLMARASRWTMPRWPRYFMISFLMSMQMIQNAQINHSQTFSACRGAYADDRFPQWICSDISHMTAWYPSEYHNRKGSPTSFQTTNKISTSQSVELDKDCTWRQAFIAKTTNAVGWGLTEDRV